VAADGGAPGTIAVIEGENYRPVQEESESAHAPILLMPPSVKSISTDAKPAGRLSVPA